LAGIGSLVLLTNSLASVATVNQASDRSERRLFRLGRAVRWTPRSMSGLFELTIVGGIPADILSPAKTAGFAVVLGIVSIAIVRCLVDLHAASITQSRR
jgi:hypothetical protein